MTLGRIMGDPGMTRPMMPTVSNDDGSCNWAATTP